MRILDSVLRKREPVAAYRTVDGGHPAPYPDMTDEQLYNYEIAFNVPRKTFDRPPVPSSAAQYYIRQEPDLTPIAQDGYGSPGVFDASPAQQPGPAADAAPASAEEQATQSDADDVKPIAPAPADHPEARPNPSRSGDTTPLDFSKPVRTITTKQPVEIITTRARHPVYKVHGYIDDDDVVTVFTLDGQLSEHGARFLENVPEQYQLYLNIYPNHNASSEERYIITQHGSSEEADAVAGAERIACVKADFG